MCRLSGFVKSNDLPLEAATVIVKRVGAVIGQGSTRADGSYDLTYSEFPALLHSATVIVEAAGHAVDERLLFRQENTSCLEHSKHNVVLVPIEEVGDAYSSILGLTIFIAPYTLYGDGADVLAQQFNHDLPLIVHHRILAYKSLLAVPTTHVDISVDTIDEPLTAAEGERIRRRGHQLNALAMIAGDGDLVSQVDTEEQIHLTSVFRTIPVYRNHGKIMQQIKDKLPAHRASPSRIAENLHDYWGKQAILSYVLQRLATQQDAWPDDELNVLEDLLIAVRDTMTEQDRLLAPLEELLRVVEEERGQ
jgi:hypothetical protein